MRSGSIPVWQQSAYPQSTSRWLGKIMQREREDINIALKKDGFILSDLTLQ